MLTTDIHAWLQAGAAFSTGLDLLTRAGHSATAQDLRAYLTFPFVPPDAKSRMVAALSAYLAQHDTPAPNTGVGERPAPPPVPTPAPEPQAITNLRLQAKALLKERDAHRAQLVQMATDADKYTDDDRYRLAACIMAVQTEIDETYQRIERYTESGNMPDAASTTVTAREVVKKYQRILALRTAISRLNKSIAQPKSTTQQQTDRTDLLAKQVELKELLEELGMDD